MGGSIEPPFYWPKRTEQAEQTARARYYEITLDSVRQSPVEALNFPQWYPTIPCPPTYDPKHRKPPSDSPEKSP